MATTTNFGWSTPDDSDLVKDGALAIRTLGSAIDTSLVDLKGGTTGQVLSKASDTDMDFTWVTSDDADAIQNSIVDAKGDLISATADNTPARLAVGNDGETLVADSSASTGLRWQGDFAAGKNKFINGDLYINQRAFSSTTSNAIYTFDRWRTTVLGDGTSTFSLQTFTAGSAPVSGYESANYLRIVTASQTTAAVFTDIRQYIEDVRTFAGQTVTFSFWAKANSGTPKIAMEIGQEFGLGGSPSSNVNTYGGQVTLSTSWARYSLTVAIPSLSGKSVGTTFSGSLVAKFIVSAGSDYAARTGSLGIQNNTFDLWGFQVETGNVATAFQTATGTLAGELAACQRYYFRMTGDPSANYPLFGNGFGVSAGVVYISVKHPVTMRREPTSLDYGNLAVYDGASIIGTPTTVTIQTDIQSKDCTTIDFSKSASFVQYRPYFLIGNVDAAAYLGLSAEL